MARPSLYSRDQLLDAALDLVIEEGLAGAAAAAVARRTGAPSGSVYHRFPSRDAMITELWLRTTERFLAGWSETLSGPEPLDVAVAAARWTVGWARTQPDQAFLLVAHSRSQILPDPVPEHLSDRVGQAIEGPRDMLRTLAERLGQPVEAVTFAVIDLPYAAVRRTIEDYRAVPPGYEEMVERAVRAVLTT